jgi:hypothetical protein
VRRIRVFRPADLTCHENITFFKHILSDEQFVSPYVTTIDGNTQEFSSNTKYAGTDR